jgi:hypothetical protein
MSTYFPVSISWDDSNIPATKGDAVHNPTGSTWYIRDIGSKGNLFDYNMKTGLGTPGPKAADYSMTTIGSTHRIQIDNTDVRGFVILDDWASDAPAIPTLVTGIVNITPNPVQTSATISFGLKNDGYMKLEVIDALGNIASVVTEGDYTIGVYNLVWNTTDMNGTPLASGSYTLRLTSGTTTSATNLVIVR